MPDIDLDKPPAPRDARTLPTTRVTLLIALSLLAGYLPSAQPPPEIQWTCGDPPPVLAPGTQGSVVLLDLETGEVICSA